MNTIIWPIEFLFGDQIFKIYYFFTFATVLLWASTQSALDKRMIKIFIICVSIGAISIAISLFSGPCQDLYDKSIKTLPILAFLFAVGYEIGVKSSSQDWIGLRKFSLWILLIIVLELMVEFFFPEYFSAQAAYRGEFKYSGFFSEPSHLSYSAFPCILLLISSKNMNMKWSGLTALTILLIFSRTSTLIFLITISTFYLVVHRASIKKFIARLALILMAIILLSFTDFDNLLAPTIARLSGIYGGAELGANISSLVYLQGIEDAYNNLIRSYGFGIGFNMMGCLPLPASSARDVLSAIGLSGLNSEDGSFLLSKLISEFGVFGIVFFAFLFFKSIQLKKLSNSKVSENKQDAFAVMFILITIYLIIFLTRTAGYFYGPFLMVAPILGAISAINCKKNRWEYGRS